MHDHEVNMVLSIGHRGAPFHAPENTLSSFRKAVSLGADMIELDVHLSSDDYVVVIHDEEVDRTTDGTGRVKDMSLSELKALDAGGGERIPLLTEVLDEFCGRVPINIELKGKGVAGPAGLEVKKRRDKGIPPEMFLVSSFNPISIADFQALGSDLPLAFLIEGDPWMALDFANEMGLRYVHTEHSFTNTEFVEMAHRRGIKVNVWTVNEPTGIAGMIAIGVDGIFTDAPERVVNAREDLF